MIDREKVVKGLEYCIEAKHKACPIPQHGYNTCTGSEVNALNAVTAMGHHGGLAITAQIAEQKWTRRW